MSPLQQHLTLKWALHLTNAWFVIFDILAYTLNGRRCRILECRSEIDDVLIFVVYSHPWIEIQWKVLMINSILLIVLQFYHRRDFSINSINTCTCWVNRSTWAFIFEGCIFGIVILACPSILFFLAIPISFECSCFDTKNMVRLWGTFFPRFLPWSLQVGFGVVNDRTEVEDNFSSIGVTHHYEIRLWRH